STATRCSMSQSMRRLDMRFTIPASFECALTSSRYADGMTWLKMSIFIGVIYKSDMLMMARRALLATAVSLAAGVAAAQGYPAKPVRMVVPFAAGGVGDTTARILAPRPSEVLRQPVIVDDRPGAGGNIAADFA